MSEIKLYDTEARMELVMNSGPRHYTAHVNHMTTEDLRSKSDIAVELAWRDLRIEQLVGENAVMLKLLTDISENHSEFVDEGDGYMCASIPLDYVSEINMYVSRDVNAENPFPATDAAINEIKAQGVEEQVSRLEAEYGEIDDVCAMVFRDLREFAASLRGNN